MPRGSGQLELLICLSAFIKELLLLPWSLRSFLQPALTFTLCGVQRDQVIKWIFQVLDSWHRCKLLYRVYCTRLTFFLGPTTFLPCLNAGTGNALSYRNSIRGTKCVYLSELGQSSPISRRNIILHIVRVICMNMTWILKWSVASNPTPNSTPHCGMNKSY